MVVVEEVVVKVVFYVIEFTIVVFNPCYYSDKSVVAELAIYHRY